MKKSLPVIFILVLFILFLLLSPLFPSLKFFYNWIICQSKYYSVIVGFSIITLGFFYYFHRIIVDANMKKIDFRRNNLKLLLDNIDNFDLAVDKILNKQAENVKELKNLRHEMRYKLFAVIDMIKYNNKILEFTEHEKDVILELTSFVDKSDVIMMIEYDDLKKEQVSSLIDIYKDKIDAAKKVCFLEMAKKI